MQYTGQNALEDFKHYQSRKGLTDLVKNSIGDFSTAKFRER